MVEQTNGVKTVRECGILCGEHVLVGTILNAVHIAEKNQGPKVRKLRCVNV